MYNEQYRHMAQRNATFEFARQQILSKVDGKENVDTKLLELSGMDDDLYIMNVIHTDLDIILNDLKKKYIPEDIEKGKKILKSMLFSGMEKGLNAAQESTSIKYSPDHFIDIIFVELEIPAEKVSAEQREELVKIVKPSRLRVFVLFESVNHYSDNSGNHN